MPEDTRMIRIQRVTDVHADFDNGGLEQGGRFYFPFVVDAGAAKCAVTPTPRERSRKVNARGSGEGNTKAPA